MVELFVQAGQFGFVASGLLPKRVGRAHLGSSRRGEAVRRGGAVRRVGILQCRGGGRVLQHRGGGRVLQHRGGAVRVRRVGALAEESRKSSSRFVATWGSCSSRWWRSSSTSRWWRSSSLSRWWRRCSSSPRSGCCCADAAPLHILQGFKTQDQSLYIFLNETFPLSSCS